MTRGIDVEFEKKILAKITQPSVLRIKRDNWLAKKRMLDAVAKTWVDFPVLPDVQKLSLEVLTKLGMQEPDEIKKLCLYYRKLGLWEFFDPSDGNIAESSDRQLNSYLNIGSIPFVISDKELFDETHDKVTQIYDWIEVASEKKPIYEKPNASPINQDTKAKRLSNSRIKDQIVNNFSGAGQWSYIRLEFCSERDRVEILINDESFGIFHFDDIGFASQRHTQELKPVQAWNKLQELSLTDGVLIGPAASDQKRAIKKYLKNLFPNIPSDSFEKRREGGYQTKFKIVDKYFQRAIVREQRGFLR